jgi:hypothetical protein
VRSASCWVGGVGGVAADAIPDAWNHSAKNFSRRKNSPATAVIQLGFSPLRAGAKNFPGGADV